MALLRSMSRAFGVCLLVFWAPFSLAAGAALEAAPASAEPSLEPEAVSLEPLAGPVGDREERVWLEPTAVSQHPRTAIEVTPIEEQPGTHPLHLNCEVKSEAPLSTALLEMRVLDAQGAPVHVQESLISLSKEPQSYPFSWDPKDAPAGTYAAHFTILRQPGMVVATREYWVRKVAWGELAAAADGARAKLEQARQALAAAEAEGGGFPYAQVRLNIAEDCVPYMLERMAGGSWRQVDRLVRYLDGVADEVRAQIAFRDVVPELVAAAPRPDLGTLRCRNGGFYAEDRPVFLLGLSLDRDWTPAVLDRARRYGLTFGAVTAGPKDTLAGPDSETGFREGLGPVFAKAREQNLSIAACVSPFDDAGGSNVDVTTADARAVIERHLRAVVSYLAEQPMLGMLCVARNPGFRFSGENTRQGFLAHVKGLYADRHEVNQTWKALFASLDEAAIGWDLGNPAFKNTERYMRTPAYQYDWLTYHQGLGTEYLAGLAALSRSLAPAVPVTAACSAHVFEPGETALGIDREALEGVFDISGCCAPHVLLDPYFAMGYPSQAALYTLLRSFSPDKPVANLCDQVIPPRDLQAPSSFAYVHSAMWEAAMAGLSASALVLDDLLAEPECLDGYATACLDLNRLAPVVAAFQQAPAPVAILWSMPSKLYADGDPYLVSVCKAYEGCSFAGYKVRFISEAQAARGELESVKVLALPDAPAISDAAFEAIEGYVKANRAVIRPASATLFDEHGHSRRDTISTTQRTFLTRGEDLPTEYLHAMDAIIAVGDLPDTPRTINKFGYPLEGARSLYVEVDGQGYLYLLNVRKEPATVCLSGPRQSGRDLISGRDMAFPARVEPLSPMLIRLDNAPVDAAVAAAPASRP